MSNVLVIKKEARRRRKIRMNMIRWTAVLAVMFIGVFFARRLYLPNENEKTMTQTSVQTLSDEIVPGEIPMLFQYDNRWRNKIYGDGTIEFTGCGPVCLSMVLCGLSGTAEYDPVTVASFADKWGYYADGAGSSWTLMSEGAGKLGLTAKEVTFDKAHIISELQQKRPIICVVGPGDFTTTGHYIVLCEIDLNNMVTVHDPNSMENSKRKWSLDELMPQIKNLWSYQ